MNSNENFRLNTVLVQIKSQNKYGYNNFIDGPDGQLNHNQYNHIEVI